MHQPAGAIRLGTSSAPTALWRTSARCAVVSAVLIAMMTVGLAGGASATGSSPPGHGSPPGQGGDSCRGLPIRARGTGIPVLDQRIIQNAIDVGEASGRCVLLIGQFNVGYLRALSARSPGR